MIQRKELEQFLADMFQYGSFEDYCHNGLQIEGKDHIHTIVFGVSFNLPFLHQAIAAQADAIVVHHGFFGKDFFRLHGVLKEKIRLLLHHEMSLFGIHLPLDAHREYGNNAQLFAYIDAEIVEPYDVGFIGHNRRQHSLTNLLDRFHQYLHPEQYRHTPIEMPASSVLTPKYRHGFLYFDNGPQIPHTIGIISGGSSKYYREGIAQGIDTFIGGSVEESTPAMSYETKTNFVNLGHYWSEKPGIAALQQAIARQFDVETAFVEIANVI